MFQVQQVRNHGAGVRVIDALTVPADEVEQARATLRDEIRHGGDKAGSDWIRVIQA